MEKLLRRMRSWTSKNNIVVWLFGLAQPFDRQHRRGLLILQIDGLSHEQFNRALMNGSMPFMSRLLAQEHYALHSLYSGVPSSTPAIQGELFYGVRGCAPAFRFKRPQDDHAVIMLEPGVAGDLEEQLSQ
ncbi:MAG: hypothetical protein KJP04_09500, partial [Arenicella sp.]|nr:hypothetical protein [Arenicella sp.]